MIGNGRFRWDPFAVVALVAAAVALSPVVALALIAASGGAGSFAHVMTHVAGPALVDTALLLAGVGLFVAGVGAPAAWFVTAYEFPGRRFAEAALLTPLALPAYVMAFAWLDLLHPIGPAQTALRAMLGYASPADLRLPDLRSLPGAVMIYGFALYPYVFIALRAAFLARMAGQTEAARLLGASEAGVFFRVGLPMARPALAASVALALMETLNDVGAAEFLSVNTLTTAIYATWINRSDLPGAAQLAATSVVVVLALVAIERQARGARGYAAPSSRRAAPRRAGGLKGLALLTLCLAPPAIGFAAPALHLARAAAMRWSAAQDRGEIAAALVNTLVAASLATVATVAVAALVAASVRFGRGDRLRAGLAGAAAIGYAVPGTVLGIGLLAAFGATDAAWRWLSGTKGLLVSASLFGVVLALSIRFFRLAASKIEAGYERLPLSLDHSARMLGRDDAAILREIHWPLLRSAAAGAALLVFVDGMKELPATLMLRPVNFETLATLLYAEAARGAYENGALAACLIVVAGLIPVLALMRLSASRGPAPRLGRAGAAEAAR